MFVFFCRVVVHHDSFLAGIVPKVNSSRKAFQIKFQFLFSSGSYFGNLGENTFLVNEIAKFKFRLTFRNSSGIIV